MMVPTLSNRDYYSNQGMDWQDSTNVARPTAHEQQFQYPVTATATPTEDLLGFDAASFPQQQQQQQRQHQQQQLFPTQNPSLQQQQQQPQQQVFNAAQATISITTMNSAAPSIAGLGKIEPSSARNNSNMEQQQIMKPKRKVIYVPTYSCNGGLDTKVSVYYLFYHLQMIIDVV